MAPTRELAIQVCEDVLGSYVHAYQMRPSTLVSSVKMSIYCGV